MALNGGALRGQDSSDSGMGFIDFGSSNETSSFVHETFIWGMSIEIENIAQKEKLTFFLLIIGSVISIQQGPISFLLIRKCSSADVFDPNT